MNTRTALASCNRRSTWCALPLLILAFFGDWAAARSRSSATSVFYAIGEESRTESQPPEVTYPAPVRLYEVDAVSLRAVRSVAIDKARMNSGMLTGNRDAILLTDAKLRNSTLDRFSAPGLTLYSQMDMGSFDVRGVNCLDHIFVHPVSGLAYFSCDYGSGGDGFVVLDTLQKRVVADYLNGPPLPPSWPKLSILVPRFVYDADARNLFAVGRDAVGLDLQNRPEGYIRAYDVAKAAGFNVAPIFIASIKRSYPPGYRLDRLVVVPKGNLVLLMHNSFTPVLILYRYATHTVLRTWSQTDNPIGTESGSDRQAHDFSRLYCGPTASRNGSRLFAMSGGDIVVWDSSTLQRLSRIPAPEYLNSGAYSDQCFAPAPDARGMWFFGKSGKIYRLDDHTGELLGEVKLPFHLISLIREP